MPKTCELTPFEHREIYNKENFIDTASRNDKPPALSEQDKRQLGRIV
ncbi:15204_t:CDS:2 [Funneliformis caledonium]|uniref:15204_t:CDS:1 n=1 Tax=Funneliformis caledonium TaxID=1117310 RepID=A0A9N9BFG4_9GLOM|nr:15204_t:CDS:2 [Funneliformis caledonium]